MVVWLTLLACRSNLPSVPPVAPVPTTDSAGDDGAYRNLLLLSIDTLRRDHVDRWATDGVQRMPFLSSLLDGAVTFREAQQCSNWTFHSTSCTLLGRDTEEIGWLARDGVDQIPFPAGQPTLARRLAEHGFLSLAASASGYLSFDPEVANLDGYVEDLSGQLQAAAVMDDGLDGLAEHLAATGAERWFLHVHVVEPHQAYAPPDEYRAEVDALPPIPWDLDDTAQTREAVNAWPELAPEDQALLEQHVRLRYDGELRWLDDQLSSRWDRLVAEGWLEDTLVVVWSDHGEQFWEHGRAQHQKDLFSEENDAVLGFWAEGLLPEELDGAGHALDLVPTALDWLGLPVPDDGTLTGFVAGEAPPDRPRFATGAGERPRAAITRGSFKLVFTWDGTLRLYDRSADPTERVDLYDPLHPEVAPLWALLEPRARKVAELAPDEPVTWPTLP